MCKIPSVCLLALSISASPVRAESDEWHEAIAKLDRSVEALREEEQSIYEQIALLIEQSKVQEAHIELLHARLTAMNGGVSPLSLPDGELADTDAEGGGEAPKQTVDHQQREDDLISECANRIAILKGKDGKAGTAFLLLRDGKSRIIVSAPWVAENGNFSLSDMYGNPIPFGQGYSSPVGFDLLGIHPEKEGLPGFELAAHNQIPAVGSRILVVIVDAESKGLSGVGGAIRGIGPDTLEIDAELSPEMIGAPILALDSGKVIGIVAGQITGVADDWALGTRHEGLRNFAVRLDRIGEWQDGDLTRFAKEAAFIRNISGKTRVAFTAHTLLECEKWLVLRNILDMNNPKGFKEIRETRKRMNEAKEAAARDAKEHSSNPHIMRTDAWIKNLQAARKLEPGGELDRNLVSLYRHILTDLSKREPDPSAHLSAYHKEQYRLAIKSRNEGIKIITEQVNRLGQ